MAGFSPTATDGEVRHALKVSETRFIVTAPDLAQVAVDAARKSRISLRQIFLLYGQHPRLLSIKNLIETQQNTGAPICDVAVTRDNRQLCGYLSFTSGTTGKPKAVSLAQCSIYICTTNGSRVYDIASQCHRAMPSDGSNYQ